MGVAAGVALGVAVFGAVAAVAPLAGVEEADEGGEGAVAGDDAAVGGVRSEQHECRRAPVLECPRREVNSGRRRQGKR